MDELDIRRDLARTAVLAPVDPAPVTVVHPDQCAVPLLLHCDHGGNAVPRSLGNLGLRQDQLDQHIGWDIGAAGVTRDLAHRLKATAVLAHYSRLVVDLNRPPGDPDAMPESSDGIVVPGNANLTESAIHRRLTALYWPYHQAIDAQLGRLRRHDLVPMIVSVHSFTPALLNRATAASRPWHVGVMFDRDERLAKALIDGLSQRPGLVIGRNEPYSGITHGYCLKAHGFAQGLPHAQIEIRQDLICTADGQAWWARLLANVLALIMAQNDLMQIAHY